MIVCKHQRTYLRGYELLAYNREGMHGQAPRNPYPFSSYTSSSSTSGIMASVDADSAEYCGK